MRRLTPPKMLFTAVALYLALISPVILNGAELSFRKYFTDNMVLQRDMPVCISGFGNKGDTITVTFGGQKKTVKVDDEGVWSVSLDSMEASSEPGKLTATSANGGKSVSISNVVVGDVFLMARQTNVDISLGKSKKGKQAVENLEKNSLYRAILIKNIPENKPLKDLNPEASSGWSEVGKKSALAMSAAAYYFGKDLVEKIKVPVGIIDLNMGPNFTIGWISRDAIMGSDKYFGKKTPVVGYVENMEKTADNFENKEKITDARILGSLPEEHPLNDARFPAAGYNAVLSPLKGIALKGILLQLGNDYPYLIYDKLYKEGLAYHREKLDYAWWNNYLLRKHAFRAAQYIVPRVPYQWRKYFGNDKLPIGLIMPPSSDLGTYAMHHVQMRELQRKAASSNSDVGLIMPGNESIPFSGQPAEDELLAERCVSWALGDVYGLKDIPACGPLYDHLKTNYSKVQIFFKKGTAEGLHAKEPGALDKFEVAGIDGNFFPAKAVIDGNTIRLSSDEVSRIAYVRYNWCANPDQGLVNSAGLPAIPFTTDSNKFIEFPRATENNLPIEYSTHACDWKSGDVAIVNGGGATYSEGGEGYLGATGIKTIPFGPNMLVKWTIPGSPADGKILPGDMIYSVNGKLLDDKPLHMVAVAIELAESEEGAGKISFGLRRNGKNIDVPLKLEVLGAYSATSPYDCPKTDKIIANSEEYLAKRGGEASGYASGGWLHTDSLFLLGTGDPKYQGYVRRVVYKMMNFDPKTKPMPKGGTWGLGHGALFLSEYYLATGDRNVLPYLKWYCDAIAATQVKKDSFPGVELKPGEYGGWRHNYPGGKWYGMLPPIGLPAMIGYTLADEAGVKIDRDCYDLAMKLFRDGQAEMGLNMYSPRITPIKAPEAIDPTAAAKGKISSHNGGRGMAAVLFKLKGDTRITNLNSLYCIFAFNNCEGGHGSNFFNGLWTPIGAYAYSKPAFINFMKNHHWYQDLRRTFNHSYKPSRGAAPAMANGLSLVIPRQRLRILGAPESIFAKNQKEMFKPALDAYYARDYKKAEKLAREKLASGEMAKEDKIKFQQLIRAAKELQESINDDLKRVEGLIKDGKLYEASLDIPQLKGVMPVGDIRLQPIEDKLATPQAKDLIKADKQRYDTLQNSLAFIFGEPKADPDKESMWQPLTTEAPFGKFTANKMGRAPEDKATKWRVKTLESISKAPKGWYEEDFDDSKWKEINFPNSWYVNHSLAARANFDVKDKSEIKALRVSLFAFRQQDIVIYLNGNLVAKVNNCQNSGNRINALLTPAALGYLRSGRNTICVATRNDWRWATRNHVSGGGFGIRLEAKIAE